LVDISGIRSIKLREMFTKKLKEGNTYFTDNGESYLVLEGSFYLWHEYLDKNPNLKNGRFECRMISENDISEKIEILKGIYKIKINNE
jgi:transposase-like protein